MRWIFHLSMNHRRSEHLVWTPQVWWFMLFQHDSACVTKLPVWSHMSRKVHDSQDRHRQEVVHAVRGHCDITPEPQRHSTFMGSLMGSSTQTTVLFSVQETDLYVPEWGVKYVKCSVTHNPLSGGLWVTGVWSWWRCVSLLMEQKHLTDSIDGWSTFKLKYCVVCTPKLKLRQIQRRSRRVKDQDAPLMPHKASCDITGTSLQRCRIMLGQNESERFFTSLWSPCQLDGVRAVIEAEGGEIPNTKNFHSTFHSNC